MMKTQDLTGAPGAVSAAGDACLLDGRISFGSSTEPISDREVSAALDRACEQVAASLPLYNGRCQNHSSVKGIYPPCENDQWTTGFWPGEIWLAREHTGSPEFLRAGEKYVESFYARIVNKTSVDHHDMGFLYSPSCVAPWKLTGNTHAREAAILGARQLLTRFQDKGGFFQAWGPMGERANYRFIIDCLMNLPLLYWAAEETGETEFAEKADRHAAACLAHSFRADHSTFHTFFMDPETGDGVRGETCQGLRADSSWARGQAWAVYGLALTYGRKRDLSILELFIGVTSYYLSKLPDDLVPYWDLAFDPAAVEGKGSFGPSSSSEPRDSSSAAIVACGLLEMADQLEAAAAPTGNNGAKAARMPARPGTAGPSSAGQSVRLETDAALPGNQGSHSPASLAETCRLLARRMIGSLTRRYAAGLPANESAGASAAAAHAAACLPAANAAPAESAAPAASAAPVPGAGLLLHGTYSKKSPWNTCTEEGVDESLAWGDYFYMEALTRLTRKWTPYW